LSLTTAFARGKSFSETLGLSDYLLIGKAKKRIISLRIVKPILLTIPLTKPKMLTTQISKPKQISLRPVIKGFN